MEKLIFLITILLLSCNNSENRTEKYYDNFDNVINVKSKIVDINMEKNFGFPVLYIVGQYLIIVDMKNTEKGIHLFDKNSFQYITSTGIQGKGPGEIGRYGILVGLNDKNSFLFQDDGKQIVWKFHINEIIKDSLYKPSLAYKYNHEQFMIRYAAISDSVAIGKAIRLISHSAFDEIMAKFNFYNSTITEFGYINSKLKGKKTRSAFNLSTQNNIYVNAYFYEDLLTICSIDGELKYNIYGKNWQKNLQNRIKFYAQADFIGNKIIASYVNNDDIIFNSYQRPIGNSPSTFLVFDLSGNYVHSLFVSYKFSKFCIDNDNKRVIMYFVNKENPFGYIVYDN